MQHVSTVVCLCLAVIFSQGQGQDAFFGVPQQCTIQSGLMNATWYNQYMSTFTPRGSMDCCYRDNTRNKCCLDSHFDGSQNRPQCRCHPSIACNAQPPCPLLCPAYTRPRPTLQAANGLTTTDNGCDKYQGIARILVEIEGNAKLDLCQAVLAKATVGGALMDVFVTSDKCREGVVTEMGLMRLKLTFSTMAFDLNARRFDFIEGPNGAGYILPRWFMSSHIPCQQPVCSYSSRMLPLESLTDCKFVSYGPISRHVNSNVRKEISVKVSSEGCTAQRNLNRHISSALCFATVSGRYIYCGSDLGAPVYCTAPATREVIFIGNAAQQECDRHIDLLVIPLAG